MPVAGGGATVTREIRWLITARDMSRVGLNSAIIALEQLGLAAQRTNFRMMLAGTGMVVASGLIIKGLMSTVDAAEEFDKGLHNIQAITRELTEKDLAALGEELLDLSMKYGMSAQTLTDAMYMIYSAEYEGADASLVLETSLQGARAGLTDVETAATSLITILKGYNLSVEESTRVMDMMFNAVDVGIFKYEELAGSFGKIISSAYQLHVPLEELLTSYVLMSRRGMDLHNAQTYLNRAMVSFLKPSEDMVKWLGSMGYESGQAYLATRGLGGMLEDLRNQFQMTNLVVPDAIMQTEDYNEVMAWMNENHIANAESLAKLFPRIQGLRAILALVSAPAEEWNDTLKNIAENTGTTMAALEKQQQSYAYQLDVFKATIEALKITIGQALIPELSELLKSWSETIQGIMKTHPDIGKTIAEIGKISAAALGASGVFLILKSTTGSAIRTIMGMLTGLWHFMGPWSIGLGLAIAAIAMNWEDFGDVLMDLKDIAISVFQRLVSYIKPVIEIVANLLRWLDRMGALVPMIVAFFGAWAGARLLAPMILSIVGAISKLVVVARSGLGAIGSFGASTAAATQAAQQGAVQTGAMSASFSAMAPAIGIAGMAIGGITALIFGLQAQYDAMTRKIEEQKIKLGEQANEIMTNTLPRIRELKDEYVELKDAGEDTTEVLGQINEEIAKVALLVPQAVESWNLYTGEITLNNGVAATSLANLALQGAALAGVNEQLATGENKWKAFKEAQDILQAAFGEYQTIFDNAAKSLGDYGYQYINLQQLQSQFADDSQIAFETLNRAWKQMTGEFHLNQNSMTEAQKQAAEESIRQVELLIAALTNLEETHKMSIDEMLQNMNQFTPAVQEAFEVMREESRLAGEEMSELPQQVIDAYKTGVPEFQAAALDSVGAYFTGYFTKWGIESPKVEPEVKALIEVMNQSDLSTEQGIANVMAYIEHMIASLGLDTDQATQLTNAAKLLVGMLGEGGAQSDPSGQGWSMGTAFAQGMAAALAAKEESIKEMAREMAFRIWNTVKLIFDIDSPSKASMWLGEMFVEGLIQGLENGIGQVTAASWDLAHAATIPIEVGAGSIPLGQAATNNNDNSIRHITVNQYISGTEDGGEFARKFKLEIERL